MPFDPALLRQNLDAYFSAQPHPKAPLLTRGEYQGLEDIAKQLHGRDVRPQQVEALGVQLKQAQIAPSEFGRILGMAKPLSQRLLGRPPTVPEVVHLNGAHPSAVSDYYTRHPHPKYPEIHAGDFARMYVAAKPIAHEYAQRNPVESEIATFIHGGYTADHVRDHYRG